MIPIPEAISASDTIVQEIAPHVCCNLSGRCWHQVVPYPYIYRVTGEIAGASGPLKIVHGTLISRVTKLSDNVLTLMCSTDPEKESLCRRQQPSALCHTRQSLPDPKCPGRF